MSNHPPHAKADEVVGHFEEAGQEACEVQKLWCLLTKQNIILRQRAQDESWEIQQKLNLSEAKKHTTKTATSRQAAKFLPLLLKPFYLSLT